MEIRHYGAVIYPIPYSKVFGGERREPPFLKKGVLAYSKIIYSLKTLPATTYFTASQRTRVAFSRSAIHGKVGAIRRLRS